MAGFVGATEQEILKQLRLMAESSAKNSKTALIISIFAIIISVFSIFISLKSNRSSTHWQKDQIVVLNSILNEEQTINQNLLKENEMLKSRFENIENKFDSLFSYYRLVDKNIKVSKVDNKITK